MCIALYRLLFILGISLPYGAMTETVKWISFLFQLRCINTPIQFPKSFMRIDIIARTVKVKELSATVNGYGTCKMYNAMKTQKFLCPVTNYIYLLFIKSPIKNSWATHKGWGGRSLISLEGLEKQLDIYLSKSAEPSALSHLYLGVF